MNKKLTIITCCYNSDKTIETCVKSILEQLTEEVEYLIIDGNSKDDTLNILNKYKNKIHIISEKDTGIYNAMNKGIMNAQGDYILFMNSDDKLHKDSLNVILESLKTNKDCYYGDTETHYLVGTSDYSKIEIAGENFKLLSKNPLYYHQSFWCKRSVIEKVGKFDEQFKIAADWELMFRLYNLNYSFEHINSVIADYYFGGVSSKWHVGERHRVRKKNKAYKKFDKYLIRDFLKFSKNLFLDKIIGIDNHNKLIIKRKGFKLNCKE